MPAFEGQFCIAAPAPEQWEALHSGSKDRELISPLPIMLGDPDDDSYEYAYGPYEEDGVYDLEATASDDYSDPETCYSAMDLISSFDLNTSHRAISIFQDALYSTGIAGILLGLGKCHFSAPKMAELHALQLLSLQARFLISIAF